MKLTPYAKALKMGKKALQEALVPVKVKKAKKQAELEMCKLEEQIAVKESNIHDVCTSEAVNFAKIIELQDDLMLLKRKMEQYQTILDEMFPAT